MKPKKQNMGKKGSKPVPNVSEAARIRINQLLKQFRASDDEVYAFEDDLSKSERALVHELSRKMGMKSRSYGRGKQRCVSVYKKLKKKGDNAKPEANITSLTFSEESILALQNLFAHYPPEDGELGEKKLGIHKGSDSKRPERNDGLFSRPSMTEEDIEKKVKELNSRIEKTAKLRQIVEDRSKLPIASFKDAITSTVDTRQVVLISGETGCGKTTQVPQFLLDHMWGRGAACKIVCTQPRRMSATSVADRIACERGENIGDNVGYKIRLESKGGRNSSIVFCTNGVLLRVLVSKGTTKAKREASRKKSNDDLSSITHIIVDEIHERDRYSDFMLAILRDILPSYPRLRVVLMSATLDAERFSQYFGGCPVISVPGFTYPVKSFYLEDVLSVVNSKDDSHSNSDAQTKKTCELTEEDRAALDEAISLAWTDDEFDSLLDLVSSEGIPHIYNYQDSSIGLTPLMVFAGKGRLRDVCMLLSFGANGHLQDKDGLTALQWAERGSHQEVADALKIHLESSTGDLLDEYLATTNPEMIDVALIEKLLRKICSDSTAGAILVFLPGWDDIKKTQERLLSNPHFNNSSKYVVISLHSLVPPAEQKKVFQRPPKGCRKIILSTNIAETAVTIDDVVYVIDSGRMKEKSYDPYNNVSTLQSSWVSKASSKQREGRAGRCQPGVCYHLYSKFMAESLPEFQVPEIRRVPIEELCLQVKLLDPDCKIGDFLQKTLDPPVPETIRNAIAVLQDIGALSQDEQLTELGEKLGHLPVHPSTSKMLFFAILVNCLDPALTIACASDYRDPFTLPMLPNEKKRAAAAKFELANLYGGYSDQLAVIAAFQCWKNAKRMGQESWFCSQYFISSTTMNMLDGMKKQLVSELVRSGFIQEDNPHCNVNSHDPGILRAVLVAGLYPMVGKMVPSDVKRIVIETANGAKVRLHPHSLNFKLSSTARENCLPLVYDEITRGDGGMRIRNCTVVGPLPILLLATEIVVAPGENGDGEEEEDDDEDETYEDDEADDMEIDEKLDGRNNEEKIMSSPDNPVRVVVDRWLYFGSKALDVAQIYCLRERLAAAILFKVKEPRKELPLVLGASMQVIASIISFEGRSGISLSCESVDSLTSMVDATGIHGCSSPGKISRHYLESLVYGVQPVINSEYGVQPVINAPGFHQPQSRAFKGKSKGNGKQASQGRGAMANQSAPAASVGNNPGLHGSPAGRGKRQRGGASNNPGLDRIADSG